MGGAKENENGGMRRGVKRYCNPSMADAVRRGLVAVNKQLSQPNERSGDATQRQASDMPTIGSECEGLTVRTTEAALA